ncbi:MAG TPA: ATP-binding protein [Arcobacter sp.]|nr:ATP-binding protein [Arcobacter sp.]
MSLNNAHEGYDYQDLITSYFILKEILLGNQNSVFSIDKKHTVGRYISTQKDKDGNFIEKDILDSFDDLVIINNQGIQRKQIKYSNDGVAKKLLKDDLANNSGYKLALFELYRTWKELNTANSEFRLCLAWDEPTDNDIKNILKPLPTNLSSFENFSTKLYKINLENLWEDGLEPLGTWRSLKKFVSDNSIDRNDFKLFCDLLLIELELPKASLKFNTPSDLENILYQQAEKLGIGQYPNDDIYILDFLERFAKKVGEYRTMSAVVNGTKILQDLRVKTDFGKIEQKFEIDQSKNIKYDEKYASFKTEIMKNKKTLIVGEPGSGKSWFLTNFIEFLEANSQKVIRHYCFTDTEDKDIGKRVSSDVFFGNLVADILKEFPQLKEVKDKLFVSNLDELNLLLSHVDKELIIIIDGLDHINRVLKSSSTLSEDKTKIIEYISQIVAPANVSIVLGSQPVEEIKTLINDFEYIVYKLPKWNTNDTLELMSKYSLEDTMIEDEALSKYLYEKSEGNPLYLTYIVKTLINQEVTMEIINNLPQYDFNLQNYYQYLTSQIDDNLTSEILSCLEFSVTASELEKINPQSHHLEKDLKIISPVLNENISRGGIKLYHDSFRRYNIEKLEKDNGLQNIHKLIAKWLNKEGFYKSHKSYRYLLGYYIKLDKYKKVKKYATTDFLTKSLYYGYSDSIIKINYDNFLYVAKESQDWELFIYISELNRTINTTLSDQINEFEERFEDYFEVIGLIYGFEKANEILFFEGKENFSDEIIAKAFYISQRNHYIPNWKKIEHYFKDEISLDKYKYFIAYLIAINKLDDNIRKNRILLFKNLDYLKILLEEVYYLEGFERILSLYEQNKCTHKDIIVNKINNILDNTNCTQRILVNNQIQHLCLPALNLDFIDDYIREGILDNFYYLVKQYSSYNLSSLEEFEKTIPSNNFFYNWLKFLIRNFIIEEKISQNNFLNYESVEKKFIENFEFLSSDISPYKGKPRVMDFTHKNEHIINSSIEQGLKYIQSKESWSKVIDYLNLIPYNTISIIEKNFINDFNIEFIISSYENFDNSEDEYYSSYLEYKLKISIYYSKIEKKKKARKNLLQAMRLVTSYTFRKDTTLDELQSPLITIDKLDKQFALKYTKKLLSLNLSVQNHSEDGKGIRWLYIDWFQNFLEVDKRSATIFLISRFLDDTYFWKYEYMFSAFLKRSNYINPIILNYLYRLMPTFIRDDAIASNYISSFADNIYKTIDKDEKIAKQSLVNILERDLNSHSEQLSHKSLKKLQVLKNILNVSIPVQKSEKEKAIHSTYGEKSLEEKLTIQFGITESLKEKNIEEINKYFDKQDRHLTDKDLTFLLHCFNEKNDDKLIQSILESLITRKLIGDENYYEKLRGLVNHIRCSDELKTYLLVKIFVFSQGGWFENFLNKDALKDAVKLDEKQALSYLSQELFEKFKTIYYYSQSTANLIIAFEHAGLKKKHILSMYKRGFESIEYRLPDDNDFNWKSIEDENLKDMSDDEIAIVMILVKFKNMDSLVQKEILSAINYLLNNDTTILIKPMQWFFKNINHFSHISIASILELFLIYVDKKQDFFQTLKDDILKVRNLENLYISNCLEKLVGSIE